MTKLTASHSAEELANSEALLKQVAERGYRLAGIDHTTIEPPMVIEQILTLEDEVDCLNLVIVPWPANGWMTEFRFTADNGLTNSNVLHFADPE